MSLKGLKMVKIARIEIIENTIFAIRGMILCKKAI